jgi:hypothetical protein
MIFIRRKRTCKHTGSALLATGENPVSVDGGGGIQWYKPQTLILS